MALKANFTTADVRSKLDKFIEVIEKRIIKRLQYLGEMVVTRAREIPGSEGFFDDTGALRSSMGYMVFRNGIAVHEAFEVVRDGAEGIKAGKMLAEKIGAKYKQGICLVVVAGMNYAVHLESKGRDVLTSAENLAKKELPRMLKELKENIKKAME